MKSFFKNPVIAFLSSLKLSAFLMAVVGYASAMATFFESDVGRDGAYDRFYDATWFEIVLGVLTISLILLFFKRWPYRPRQWGFALVHVAIVVILISAGITRYFGYEGIMPIREGGTTDYIYSDKKHVKSTIGTTNVSFPVRLWKYGENDIWRDVEIGGEKYEVGVTEYWPRFTEEYAEGPGGPAAIEFGETRGGEVVERMLIAGENVSIGDADARFLTGGFSGEMSASRYGDLRLNIDGESCTVPVTPGSEETTVCGGYSFRITEFQTRFQVGGPSNPDGPMTNPMIRVAITAPDGSAGERILFAYHPDFSQGHSGADDPFAGLNMMYSVNRGFEVALGGATGYQARASFPVEVMDMNGATTASIPAGEVFDLQLATLYAGPAADFTFVPARFYESVVLQPALSDQEGAPPAARIAVRAPDGEQVDAICVETDRGQSLTLNGVPVVLSYGSVIKKLPYSLTLDDFVLETYPGSDNPATYESWVTLNDPEQGISGKKVHIYMNNPLTHRGSKHFQSSYDRDRRGTILSVNHDPGKWPTYFGYTLISIGFILIMLKDLLPGAKRKKTAASLLAGLLAFGGAGSALAQDGQDHSGHDHSGHNHPVSAGYVTLSDPAREMASRLIIQDYRGRMKPLDTLAREVTRKVTVEFSHEDRDPIDLFLSWSLNPNFWADKPVVAVRYPGVKDLLGVDHATTHITYNSMFDAQGRYRISEAVEAAHRTPDADRSKTQRKLITFNDRFEQLYMAMRGGSLRLFPIPGDENNTWVDIQEMGKHLNAEQGRPFGEAYDTLAAGIRSGDNAQIMDGLARVRALQQQYGAEVMPSKAKVDAELRYNRSNLFFWMMIIPLPLGAAILMGVFLWNLFRNHNRKLSFRNVFYSLGMLVYAGGFLGMVYAYVLRWIASGRAPLSNGHESLLFISLAVALAGLIFELAYRKAAPGSLGSLLTFVVLGISMSSMFSPDIGPLVPVLVSYWLNIHVTVIVASYGFLGLSALIGALVMLLLLAKAPGRKDLKDAIAELDRMNKHVIIAGLGLLTVGTLLGGVWANESWGRYWGWDAKETWSLITILVYAVVLHFRWIPNLRSIWLNAAATTAAVSSVVMTYFGVNYFLTGLHSYAAGDAAKVPGWVFIGIGIIVAMAAASGIVNATRSWEPKKG